mgnify:FL=1
MANPTWFDYEFYMGAKLAQMQKADPAGNWTTGKLVDAFAQNGFLGEDGAYEHFVQFGANEDVAPNADFNASEYYAAKAAQFYGVEPSAVTELQIANVKAIIAENGMNAWTHYVQYGSDEGVNPSNAFDADAYLDAKTAALVAAGEKQPDGSEWTPEAVQKAISDAGMTVLEHYLQYAGTGEGEVAQGVTFPVPDDQKVPAEVTGNTYVLTPDLDAIVGTNGSDVIIGATQDGKGTFTSGDSIDGGEGVDTLKLYGVDGVSKGLQTVKNVEQLEAFAGSGTYDVSGWEGLEKASFKAGTVSTLTANATLTDVALDGVGADMKLTGDGIANVTVKNLDEDRAVTVVNTTENHALNVALENASKVGKDGVPTTSVTLVDAAAEALNLASNGATVNSVTLSSLSAALKTMTVSGEADLVVEGLANVSKLESIDGSAAKGDLALGTLNGATLNVTTGSGDDTFVLGNTTTHAVTVSTGEGDDEVTLGAALAKGSSIDLGAGDDVLKLQFTQLNKDATVNGGEGTDALVFTNDATLTSANADLNAVKGFEVLGVEGATLTVDSTKVDFSDFLVSDSGKIVLTNAQDNDTVTFEAGASTDNSITMAARNTVLDLNLAGDGKAVANVSATVEGATTLNISSTGLLEEKASTLTADNNVLNLTGDNAKLNLTGDQDLTLTLKGSTKGFTVDATGFEAKLDVTGSDSQDTIKLGAEGGTVTASKGHDQITFGAGADAFVASTVAGTNAADMSTIAGFTSGTDKILTAADASTAGTTTNVHITSTAVANTSADILDALTTALDVSKHNLVDDNAYVVELTGELAGTYVVLESGDTVTTVDANDTVIKLAGVHAADIAVGDILFS